VCPGVRSDAAMNGAIGSVITDHHVMDFQFITSAMSLVMKSYGQTHDEHDEEERKGLLTDPETVKSDDQIPPTTWSRRVAGLAVAILALIVCGFVARTLLLASPPTTRPRASLHFNGDTLRSNGTHDFKRTLLIVSIDGMR
jgi:hypothetical protein